MSKGDPGLFVLESPVHSTVAPVTVWGKHCHRSRGGGVLCTQLLCKSLCAHSASTCQSSLDTHTGWGPTLQVGKLRLEEVVIWPLVFSPVLFLAQGHRCSVRSRFGPATQQASCWLGLDPTRFPVPRARVPFSPVCHTAHALGSRLASPRFTGVFLQIERETLL